MGRKCKYTTDKYLTIVFLLVLSMFSCSQVGSNFGYFPKDLLAINHIYTEKEFEIPAEV